MEKKKSNKKRILTTLLATVGIASVATAFTLTASANNYTDTDATYWVGGYSYSWTEAARLKTDSSYGYQKCISTTVPYYSWVYGSWVEYPNQSQVNSDPTDPVTGRHTPSYTFNTGTTYYMVNWVYENGIPYAGMAFMNGGGQPGWTHIRWSPDSI
mgnify:CR=1 FL=1